jgi:predicted transcriptional regulator
MMKWNEAKEVILRNKKVRNELENNEAEYKIIEEIITARREKNITQKELAELVGTKQANISRLESGNYNPTLEFLTKIAKAVGKELEIRMI